MDISKIPTGANPPKDINVLIEIPLGGVPVKYELDKATGLLKIDRPQKFSNVYPTLYGFLPQTYCGDETVGQIGAGTGKALSIREQLALAFYPTKRLTEL